MPRDYRVFLQDALDAIANVAEFVGAMTLEQFKQDKKTLHAVGPQFGGHRRSGQGRARGCRAISRCRAEVPRFNWTLSRFAGILWHNAIQPNLSFRPFRQANLRSKANQPVSKLLFVAKGARSSSAMVLEPIWWVWRPTY